MDSEPNMGTRKHTIQRKKACQNCTIFKVRCVLEKPTCSRSWSRSRQCRYPSGLGDGSSPAQSSERNPADESLSFDPSLADLSTLPTAATFPSPVSGYASDIPHTYSPRTSLQTEDTCLNFDDVDLVPMANAEDIRNCWLQPYLFPAMGQLPKLFNPFTVQFLTCVLRSYPNHLLEEKSLPPFIHPLQISSKAMPRTIANCFSLVRMWMNRVAGSEAVVLSTIRQEMERLSQKVVQYDPIPSLKTLP